MPKSYYCNFCNEDFTHSHALATHVRTHHNHTVQRSSFLCEVCGEIFGFGDALTNHMRTHTDELSFSCSVCGNKNLWHEPLAEHMPPHTDECPLLCEVCGSSLAQTPSLNQYMRTVHGNIASVSATNVHTGQGPSGIITTTRTFINAGSTTTITSIVSPTGSANTVTVRTPMVATTVATQSSGLVTSQMNPNLYDFYVNSEYDIFGIFS